MPFVSHASPTSTSVFSGSYISQNASPWPSRKQRRGLLCVTLLVLVCRWIKWKWRSSERQEEELLTWLSNLNPSIFCHSGRLCPLQLISPCMLCERWSKMAAQERSWLSVEDGNQTQALPIFEHLFLWNSIGPWHVFKKKFLLDDWKSAQSSKISPNFISMPLAALFTSWGESCDGEFRWYSSHFDFNQHFLTWQEYEYKMKALILHPAVLGFHQTSPSKVLRMSWGSYS